MRYSRDHADQTRQRLIEAAATVLRAVGLKDASIARIAATAGVTHGAVYRHFANKDALLQAALPHTERALRDSVANGAANGAASGADWVMEAYLAPDAPTSLLAALAGDMPHASPYARAIFDGELRHLLAALQDAGDPGETGYARLALLVGGLVLARGVNDPGLAEQALAACRQTARRLPGLLRDPAPPIDLGRFADAPDFGAADPVPRRRIAAGGTVFSFADAGQGRPVVFLNSIAFTSYCWRNVIAHLAGQVRCLAPDLPGSGQSGPSPRGYRVFDQVALLEAWLDALDLAAPSVFVGHEWGATLAFELARRRPSLVAGIVHLGATLNGASSMFPSLWSAWHRRLREPGGDRLLLEDDRMLDRQLSRGTLRRLDPEVQQAYRAMWPVYGQARLPLLRLVQDMPIDGGPADVAAMVASDMAFMAGSDIPKLFLRVVPGWRRFDPDLAAIRAWPNQQEIDIPGVLLPMEDVPDQLAAAVLGFVEGICLERC